MCLSLNQSTYNTRKEFARARKSKGFWLWLVTACKSSRQPQTSKIFWDSLLIGTLVIEMLLQKQLHSILNFEINAVIFAWCWGQRVQNYVRRNHLLWNYISNIDFRPLTFLWAASDLLRGPGTFCTASSCIKQRHNLVYTLLIFVTWLYTAAGMTNTVFLSRGHTLPNPEVWQLTWMSAWCCGTSTCCTTLFGACCFFVVY